MQAAGEPLRQLLLRFAERVPVPAIDRLWLFPVRPLGARDSGLIVISTLPVDPADDHRRVLTLRYELQAARDGLRAAETLVEQGTAPADRVDRIIDGVIRRLGDAAGDPVEHRIGGDPDRWSHLLQSFGDAAVDPASGE